MARRVLLTTLVLIVASAAVALAAGPLHGKTYKTTTPATGTNSRNEAVTIAAVPMTLKVSGNGKTVTVHFGSDTPILYCSDKQQLQVQTSKPAKISAGGSFTAKVDERFSPGVGEPAIVQVVTGRFSGSTVHGTIRTEAPPCSGTADYSARA